MKYRVTIHFADGSVITYITLFRQEEKEIIYHYDNDKLFCICYKGKNTYFNLKNMVSFKLEEVER